MARICMVAYSEYKSDARIRREAEALAARGDNVDCICLSSANDSAPKWMSGVRLLPVAVHKYQGSNVRHYMSSYMRFFILSTLLLTKAHLRERYDVVQVHTMPDFMVFTALPARLLGVKVLLDIHDLVPELYMSKFGLPETHPLIRTLALVERLCVAFAHRAISVHEAHLDVLVRHGNPRRKFIVLLNSPDPSVFARRAVRRKRVRPFTLVYHGTVSRRHGLDLVFQAIHRLRDRIPDLRFDIIGNGDDIKRLFELAGELEIRDKIRFIPGVPVHELPQLLSEADVGVVPLKIDCFTQYMLPVKLMEYVALGIPAIVTRTETVRRYFDDDMVEFISGDNIEELALKILGLYTDASRRTLLCRNADRFTALYSWREQKGIYYALVDSLIRPRIRIASRVS